MQHNETDSHGFTLIELLVSVAIIALLVGVLLPALGSARRSGQAAVCGSNIRQLTMANLAYTNDNANHLALAAKDLWHPNLERWHGKRDIINAPFEPYRSDMASYFGESGQVKHCPNFDKGFDYQTGFEDGCGGYGYNASYLGGRCDLYGTSPIAAQNSARVGDINTPVYTVMFTDCAYIISRDYTKAAYSFCEPPFWQLNTGPPSNMRPDPTIDFRHTNTTTAAWSDGHINRQQLTFSVDYQTHSYVTANESFKQNVGWFGPEDNSLFDLE